jgi:multidrug resistance efflux pump
MTEGHEQQAEQAERELADMQDRSEQVEQHIDEARKDWEQKKADPAVPGAGGDPDRAEEGGRHPETAYPAKGSSDEASADDPGGDGGESGGGEGDMPPPDPHETD